MTGTPLTEDWLKANGFKWHQLDRQPDKHWLLWVGGVQHDRTCFEDLGIELAPAWWQNRVGDDIGDVGNWHCWLRSDLAGRYTRFLHARYVRTVEEVIALAEALTGQSWNPANNLYGIMRRPEQAQKLREEYDRLDRAVMRWNPHAEAEKDDTRGRALPEHLNHHIKTVEAKNA